MRLLRYAFDEAAASLWRGRSSGLLSTATIAIALFVLGAFLIVTSNLERLAEEWSGAAELSVYVADDLGEADRASIEQALNSDESVAAVDFVTKADALRRFSETFSDLAATVTTLEQNPLPASFDVRLRASASAQARVDGLVVAAARPSGRRRRAIRQAVARPPVERDPGASGDRICARWGADARRRADRCQRRPARAGGAS